MHVVKAATEGVLPPEIAPALVKACWACRGGYPYVDGMHHQKNAPSMRFHCQGQGIRLELLEKERRAELASAPPRQRSPEELLTAENARLRAALKPFAEQWKDAGQDLKDDYQLKATAAEVAFAYSVYNS